MSKKRKTIPNANQIRGIVPRNNDAKLELRVDQLENQVEQLTDAINAIYAVLKGEAPNIIPNRVTTKPRVCEHCSEIYQPTGNTQKYCSKECHTAAKESRTKRKKAAKRAARTRTQKVKGPCPMCLLHEERKVDPNMLRGNQKFCSTCAELRKGKTTLPANEWQPDGKYVFRHQCQQCFTVFCATTEDRVYCSGDCHGQAISMKGRQTSFFNGIRLGSANKPQKGGRYDA